MTRTICGRQGMTLLELIIVIAIMGIMAAVSTMAVRQVEPPRAGDPLVTLRDSSRRAVAESRDITIHVVVRDHPVAATAFADGSIVADSELETDRLSGTVRRAR